MEILAMADLHGHLPDIREYLDFVDIIVIAGDIAPDYSYIPQINTEYQTGWFNTVFLKWATTLNKPVFGCYGNHDYGTFKNNTKIKINENKVYDNFLLFSWTREFCGWNYMVKDLNEEPAVNNVKGSIEDRLISTLSKCKKIPEIWVSHGPPYRVCEFKDDYDQISFAGSRALYSAIKKYHPKVVFVGHIHNGVRTGQIGDTQIFNCSVTDNALNLIRDPIVVSISIEDKEEKE